jgi:hypothetical protein
MRLRKIRLSRTCGGKPWFLENGNGQLGMGNPYETCIWAKVSVLIITVSTQEPKIRAAC